MDIKISLTGQQLSFENTFVVVSGSQKFIRFVFDLSEDWTDLLSFVQFGQDGQYYNVYLDDEKSAYLPAEITEGTCSMTLMGTHDEVIATTNTLYFIVSKNLLVSDAQSSDITLSLYQQLVDKINWGSAIGLKSIEQTSSSTDSDGLNVFTVTFIDDTTQTFTIRNGSQGEKGDQGIQGIQGEKGEKGEKGDQGIQGEKGDKGDAGAQGIQGEKGDKGDQGIQGIQGEKGEKGDQGIQGEKGEKGEKGDQGIQGIQGEKGDTGEKGADGKTPVKGTDYMTDSDISEMVEKVETNVKPLITEEATTRKTADTALTTSIESLSDKIANKYEALANAKIVEIKKYISNPLEANGVGDWIALTYARTSKTAVSFDNSIWGGTIYYYDSFATALSDFNNCVTTSGSTTKSDASVCSLYISTTTSEGKSIYSNIPILTLLADVEYNDATITLSHDGILNLNGHTLKSSQAIHAGTFQGNQSILIYGKKANSKLELTNALPAIRLYGRNIYLYYGNYNIKTSSVRSSAYGLIYVNNLNSNLWNNSVVDIVGVKMELESEAQATDLSASVAGIYQRISCNPFTLIMENVNMIMNGHNSHTYGVKCDGVYSEFTCLKNCTISVTSDDFGSSNDSAAIGVRASHNVYIEGCDIDATNHAVSCINAVIRNSVLKGGVHGGVYSLKNSGVYAPFNTSLTDYIYRNFTNLNDELNTYVQNCTIKKVNKSLKSSYGYACYISGNIWFDNCTFENEVDGEFKAPAIKVQSGQTEVPLPYFSNCNMGNKIRVDSGLTAYFGKGMDESIKVYQNGTIERTNDTYASIPMVTTQYVESMTTDTTTT